MKEFSDVFEGHTLYLFLLYNISCCFVKAMSPFEAGIMSLYYGNKTGRMIFGVFGEAIDQLFYL